MDCLINGFIHTVAGLDTDYSAMSSTLARLRLKADKLDAATYDVRLAAQEEGELDSLPSRKKAVPNVEDLKRSLEGEFLTPSTQFSPDWLNKLQR